MLRLFLAAMLAVVAVPAKAAYFVDIQGSFANPYTMVGDRTDLEPYYSTLPLTFSLVGTFDAIVPRSGFYEGEVAELHIGTYSADPGALVSIYATEFTLIITSVGPVDANGIAPSFFLGFENNGGAKWITGFAALSDRVPQNQGYASFKDPSFSKLFVDRELTLPVPEPATWAMLIAGFGLLGGELRRHVAALRRALD